MDIIYGGGIFETGRLDLRRAKNANIVYFKASKSSNIILR